MEAECWPTHDAERSHSIRVSEVSEMPGNMRFQCPKPAAVAVSGHFAAATADFLAASTRSSPRSVSGQPPDSCTRRLHAPDDRSGDRGAAIQGPPGSATLITAQQEATNTMRSPQALSNCIQITCPPENLIISSFSCLTGGLRPQCPTRWWLWCFSGLSLWPLRPAGFPMVQCSRLRSRPLTRSQAGCCATAGVC